MKCISCGAEIGLTDKVCAHCGRVITENAGYRADMDFYKADSAKTMKRVREIIAENIPMVISAGIMIVLVIAVIATAYVKENAYGFREDAARRESVRQYEAYSPVIQDYLDAGDYTGFAAFEECHNIAEWEEPYASLDLLVDMAGEYTRMVSSVEEAVMFGPDAHRYDPESAVDDCHSAVRIFYSEFDRNLSDIDADPYRDYIYDMRTQADMIMEVYLGLDEAGRSEYFAESDIKQKAYLEEVLLHD